MLKVLRAKKKKKNVLPYVDQLDAGVVAKNPFLVVYFMFSKEGLHKVQDCSPQKKKEIRNMVAKRENRESRGIFLNLIDS